MPPFYPNDYLFEKHADKGKEKWEIYAWAVRDIMCKVGGFETNDQHYIEKIRYETLLGYRQEKKAQLEEKLL